MMEDQESEDKQALLFTKDGTVDFFGRPAIKFKTGGWRTSSFILGTQVFASVAYFGVATNLILYLTKVLHEGNAAAANNVSNWLGTAYFTSIIGAFLGDAYWGRFWTAGVFLIIHFLGMILLTLSATLPSLRPPKCNSTDNCPHASPRQTSMLYLALYVVALGNGGYQPCLTSFGADQFDKEDIREQTQATRFFSWYYASLTGGAIVSGVLLVYIEDNVGWGLGYGIATASVGLAASTFFAGIPFYRHHKAGGNPFTRVAQVFVASVRKNDAQMPSDSALLYEVEFKGSAIQGSRKIQHTDGFRFLDKAAVELDDDMNEQKNPWKLCTVTQVEEVKCMIRMLPIWLSSIVFSAVYTQMTTLFVEQGATMDTRAGRYHIPPASLSTFGMLSVLIWTPAYEYLVVPVCRKITGNKRGLTSLQRMGIGLVIVTAAMTSAALVEIFRLKTSRKYGLVDVTTSPVPMSVFWQVPQYFLVGAAEVFNYIGQLDFFYEQSPDAVRGIGIGLSFTSFALGNYMSSFVVMVVMNITTKGNKPGWIPDNLNHGHMDYFYWLLTGLSIINLIFYVACAICYKNIKINNDAQTE